VFENRMLRRIFGLKRDEVTGGWRKLQNEPVEGFCEHGNEPPGSIKCWEVLE
jgi:hypothetical protein